MPLDMNPEIRAQWCIALRSGDYEQTAGNLRKRPEEGRDEPAGYCCLGVLTDLWIKAGHSEMVADELEGEGEDGEPLALCSVWDHSGGVLSWEVAKWAGLACCDPDLLPGEHGTATWVNDSGQTFAEIADLIDGGEQP